ncbi:class I SAM-dependent methyltransferase [Oleiagrimonas citrea]
MLLQELSQQGVQCTALETSPQARKLIQEIGRRSGHAVALHDAPSPTWAGMFPLLMAFEVLEHIEDDALALEEWRTWMQPDGLMLMSVPAHTRLWSAADVWAGHYRRYSKKNLLSLLTRCGFEVEHIECFGFPLGNLTERIQARSIAKSQTVHATHEANNARSGIERNHVMRYFPWMKSMPGKLALRCAFAAQAAFSTMPFGNGYLVRARRRG